MPEESWYVGLDPGTDGRVHLGQERGTSGLQGNAWREVGCLALAFRAFAICLLSLAELRALPGKGLSPLFSASTLSPGYQPLPKSQD